MKTSFTFTFNNLSKLYWIVGLCAGGYFGLSAMSSWIGKGIVGAILLGFIVFFLFLATNSVLIDDNEVTCKNIFRKKTVQITPASKIYVKENLHRYYYVFLYHDYQIRIVNGKEELKINANVNEADVLFRRIAKLETQIITPTVVEEFNRAKQYQFDHHILLTEESFRYKNREYRYETLMPMQINNGHLQLVKSGKLRPVTVLNLSLSDIPNLQTFFHLIEKTSGLI